MNRLGFLVIFLLCTFVSGYFSAECEFPPEYMQCPEDAAGFYFTSNLDIDEIRECKCRKSNKVVNIRCGSNGKWEPLSSNDKCLDYGAISASHDKMQPTEKKSYHSEWSIPITSGTVLVIASLITSFGIILVLAIALCCRRINHGQVFQRSDAPPPYHILDSEKV